jgi:hypothetical protein
MFADTLTLIAHAGTTCAGVGSAGADVRQTKTGGAPCPGGAERFTTSALSTDGFERLLPTPGAIYCCRRGQKARSWRRNDLESGECRFK